MRDIVNISFYLKKIINIFFLMFSTSSLHMDDTPSTSPQYREFPPSETAKQDLRDSDSEDDVVVRKKRKFRFDDSDDEE